MAYYLSNERNQNVVEAYRRYQEYLRQHEREFPRNAFALATAEWYQNPGDHRCPHDGSLENLIISESADTNGSRAASIRTRLMGAYRDGYVEFFYPRVLAYVLESLSCSHGLGDWLYDEFRISPNGNVIHEIEWSGSVNGKDCRWIIEASDVHFQWIQQPVATTH